MANYSYAGLQVVISADTKPMTVAIRAAATQAGDQASAEISGRLARGFKALAPAVKGIAKGVTTGLGVATAGATAFGVASFRTAARVGEMNATLKALAASNRVAYPTVERSVKQVRAQGIEYGVAQNLAAQFMRNQLKLADSTKLATVAQNAAVISGQNSSDTLDQLIHGITTQNSLVLRNAGVNVQAGQAMAEYAKQLGKSQTELTSAERSQAVLNAVIAAGGPIANAYAAAMEEPGKVLRSFPRIINDIQVSVGKGLVDAFGPLILKSYELAKAISGALEPGGKLAPIFKVIGDTATRVAKPLTNLVETLTRWVKNVPAAQIARIADAIKRVGPALAAVGAGAALFAGQNLLGDIPVLGKLLQGLTGPLSGVATAAGSVGKEVLRSLVPSLSGAIGPATGLGKTLGGLAGPLGLAAAGFALLMAVSPEFRKAVTDVARELLAALRPALAVVVDTVRALAPVLADVAKIAGGVLAQALRATLPLIQLLGATLRLLRPALGPLAYGILAIVTAMKIYNAVNAIADATTARLLVQWAAQRLSTIATAVATKAAAAAQAIWNTVTSAGAIKTLAIATATKIWTAAQWLLNLALNANPIGLIVVALAALGAGLYFAWTRSAAFRTVVIAAWDAIRAATGWLINVVMTLVRWITGGSPGLIPAFQSLLSIVGTVVSFIRNTVIGVFNAMRVAVQAAWTVIQIVTSFTWGLIRSAIVSAVTGARNAVNSALNWMQGRVSAVWNFILNSTRGLWGQIHGAITGAWNAIRGTVERGVSWVRDRITNTWNTILTRTRDMWNRTVGAIGSAWNRIVGIVRAPVKTLVNSVINPLINGINTLITKIGMGRIAPIKLGFASGGKVPGAGRGDIIPAMLEPGETVVTRRDSARPDFRAWARARRIPGYLQGGIVGEAAPPEHASRGMFDFIGKGWNVIVGAGKNIVSEFGKYFREGVAKAFELMTKPLKGIAQGFAKSPELFRQYFGKQLVKALETAVEFIRGKEETAEMMGGGGTIAELAAQVMAKFKGLVITSALRPGDPGYHGRDMARDLGGPVGLMNRAGAWMQKNMAGSLLEGIHNPTLSVKNYKRVSPGFWGSGTWAGHADHIHMAAEKIARKASLGAATGPDAIRRIVVAMANQFGVPWIAATAMARIRQESGFNPRAINRWDINWQQGTPSVGLAQIIGPTFAAYSGPYRNKGPFWYGVSLDPLAQIYTMFRYSISRYGKAGLTRAWSGTQGYEHGGTLYEPVFGFGLRSGEPYSFGERAPAVPEVWTPLDGHTNVLGERERRTITVNVYPRERQSETEIAAAVSRRLGWAIATGRAL